MSATGSWRPIGTAPKDGTAILVMRNDWPGEPSGVASSCKAHNTYVASWWGSDDNVGEWTCYMSMIRDPKCPIEPTHWMPLPEPPRPVAATNEEREPPKVFGRTMIPVGNGRWLLNIGTLTLVVEHYDGGFALGWSCEVIGQPYMVGSDLLSGLDEAVEWLESNARRIMRECFEIAGPMVAVEILGSNYGAFANAALEKRFPVRFQ